MNTTELETLLSRFEDADAPPMWVFDQESLAFLAVNNTAKNLYGYTEEEFLSMTILDIRPVEDVAPLVKETLDPAHRGPSTREKWRHKTKDGVVFRVEITSWELTYKGRKAELVRAVPVVERKSGRASDLRRDIPEGEKRDCR